MNVHFSALGTFILNLILYILLCYYFFQVDSVQFHLYYYLIFSIVNISESLPLLYYFMYVIYYFNMYFMNIINTQLF